MPTPSVVVEHLSKSFGETRAVEDVSFEVQPGEVFGLLGPNGAGKTTTIRMMLDIFRPDSGHVEILGSDPAKVSKDRIGYLPEDRGLYKDVSLEQVLTFLATLKGLSDGEAKRRLVPWLERMDLHEHRRKKVQELSKGMQQKAQVIATLLHEPDLIVVDEPFAGLDPVNTRLIKEIIQEQVAAGRSVIMSTHQMYQVQALCDRIVLIDHGSSVLYGRVDEIRREFAANAIILEGEGDFSGLPQVLEARQEDGGWHLSLEAEADPQEVLRALAARPGVRLERFERAEPSLDDIFITVVTDGRRTGTGRDARNSAAGPQARRTVRDRDGRRSAAGRDGRAPHDDE
ncbi:MAG: ATP-binding cassette domain-containing protein [Thermoleophilia bacterium]|nr:ATP-binding cassette domain-containing protein [Thermoleophilia bacterium]